MTDAVARPIETGLAAWRRGDLDGLEQVLHPAVTLKAIHAGPWDCHSRDDVMALLRMRAGQSTDTPRSEVTIEQIDDSTFLATGLSGPQGTATLVTVADDLVVSMQQISTEPPNELADLAVTAIRAGDLSALGEALDSAPALATEAVPGHQGRTLLHIATDWPGYWPHGSATVELLLRRGADPNHRGGANDGTGETPLHWAASSDDVAVAAALIQGGADIEAPNGSIGTPLDNAVGYGCLAVARLLVDRGARVDKLWHAAALGDLATLERLLAAGAEHDDINQAFWHACGAAQRRAAERLLQAGADLNWSPDYAEGTALDAASGRTTQQDNVIEWLTGLGLGPTASDPPS